MHVAYDACTEPKLRALDDVLMTHQLSRRASRASDYEAEARVLGALASDLATKPRELLHKVAEAVLTLCRTDSAGVSVLEPGGANGVIRWHAVAGRFAPDLSGSMPRDATPCGYAIARNEVMLFERAAQYFPELRSVEPPIYEILLAPWNAHGGPAGTLWAISHTPERHFDPEDARLLTSLACFASVWHTAPRLDLANAGRDELERRTLELSHANATLEGELRDRRAAEARIKALLKRLVTIQEEERRRMARDIHDQLGQQMTALRMSLESLRAACGGRPPVDDRAAWAQRLAEELDRSIDFLTWELRPASLDDLGLSSALGNLVRGWSHRFGVPAEYEASGTDGLRMAPDVEANLYRLAQEALHNIYKHAAATRVNVSLERRDGHVLLAIEDDGCGFSPAELARQTASPRLGLVSMRERARLAGGEIRIESLPGRGTAIYVHVPVGNE